jgi:hypothetical protein
MAAFYTPCTNMDALLTNMVSFHPASQPARDPMHPLDICICMTDA